jgi:hypothetical protein
MMLKDIVDYLAAHGIGTWQSTLFATRMPTSPDACVCLYQLKGKPLPLDWSGEEPGLQVICRSTDGDLAHTKAKAIEALLHDQWELTINGHRYLRIWADGSAIDLERDKQERAYVSQNYQIIKDLD